MATSSSKLVENVIDNFSILTQKPEIFLTTNEELVSKLQGLTKKVYDEAKSFEATSANSEALPELLLAGFDDEQVWQELELQNTSVVDNLLLSISQLTTASKLSFIADKRDEKVVPEQPDSSLESEDDHIDIEYNNEVEEDDDEDDNLQLETGINFGGPESDDESEEEKELKKLLDRASKMDQEIKGDKNSDSDDEEGSLFGDNIDEELGQRDTKDKSKDRPADEQRKRKTIGDDAFFRMADLESFLDREDAKEERKRKTEDANNDNLDDDDTSEEEEEEVDVYADIPSDDEGVSARKIRYKDFFDPPTGRVNKAKGHDSDGGMNSEDEQADQDEAKADEEMESSDQEDDDIPSKKFNLFGDDKAHDLEQKKSSFELRQERLAKKIKAMEDVNLGEKPWQLMGEASAKARPENSLLQEDLDFEQQTRLAPEVTEETTKSLEDIIIQRIKDQAWDDVERKVKPIDNPFEYKKRIVLDQEKSKKGLGEIYEEEYLKQAEREKEEKEDPHHEEIKKSMRSLFIQLDALTNFHYTPKQAAPEVKVLTNIASITVEEVAPVTVSAAAMMAPEEIVEKDRRDLKGDTEKTKEDKKSERRAKRLEKRAKNTEREKRRKIIEKLNPGMGNKYAKVKAMDDLEKQSKRAKSGVTVIKSSKGDSGLSSAKFFTQLQDEVNTKIKATKGTKKTKKNSQSSSAKLKL